MKITIVDDFAPKKIQISGQCFRVKETEPGVFRFITGEHVLYIKESDSKGDAKAFDISCSKKEWEKIWMPYFDMDRNYADICNREYGKHSFSDKAIDCGRGLRILKQDKWEMLISFIISQRKSIPAISSAVEAISAKFGTKLDDEIYAFPTSKQMAGATLDDLKECGLGYRAPYVYDAIRRANSGELDLEKLDDLDDEGLFEALMEVHGVGKKVSNCVCLFAYARMGRAPVDVWIARAIDEEFGGVNPFPEYGENAGIIQQYIFYYEKNGRA
ncbi:DNA glycosylase [Butyrivibrio sp. FC2001]|jgi:N-glycosylase/DNA lyase|uniref:DNA glycosylase n=1 Tax=Butyrivibrio sp. FC2001 TaxID=1280671 RepID=UPI000416AA23|nr:DNA glycosylase [Butyrivibrio sp. FC2001]MCR5341915.1 DNA-3-methyladenine glycosylase 2 family protein [Butyrivibrio sp.]